nr:polysaccharide biosynthesis C-terminal domain-containing protein [uncultured Methanomethylovorans sp.]
MLNAAFGFFFWIVAAKKYVPLEVGTATALLSSMNLLIQLSRLGLDTSMIRFFPEWNKNIVFNTSVIVTSFSALIMGSLYIFWIDIFSPELKLLKSITMASIFLFCLLTNSLATLLGTSFVALRKAGHQFTQNIILCSRVIFLILFVSLGSVGIFSSYGFSSLLAIIISIILITKSEIEFKLNIDASYLRKSLEFSIPNYFVNLFILTPATILPIIVYNKLGSQQAAYYYICYTLVSLLYMIPNSISTSLFVEGSNGEKLKTSIIKSMCGLLLFLVPATLIMYLFPNFLLGLIGADYSKNGENLLRIMSISSIFVSINYIYYSIERIRNNPKRIFIVSLFVFVLLLGLSRIFIQWYGLVGIGYAWFSSYFIGCIFIIGCCLKEVSISAYLHRYNNLHMKIKALILFLKQTLENYIE